MKNDRIKVKSWIEADLKNKSGDFGRFRMSDIADSTLLSASFAVHIYELLDLLGELSDRELQEWSSYFLNSQEEKKGLFFDKKFNVSDTVGSHDESYLSWQFTYFSLHALDALGHKAKFNLSFLDAFLTKNQLERWFKEMKWNDFWYESNNIMFLLFFLEYSFVESGEKQYRAAIDHIFILLDKYQDPVTGYWGTDRGSSLFNGMAGAAHIVFFYCYYKKELGYKEEIISNTLQLQGGDSLFSEPGKKGGGSCEDLDAINILCCLRSDSFIKRIRSRFALKKVYRKIKSKQDFRTGAFSYNFSGSREEWNYSGWKKMNAKFDRPDLWSTYFRLLGLAFIDEWAGNDNEWKFRKMPSLGWYSRERII